MAKYDKYYPNYHSLYPDTDISQEVLDVLRKSDRKMKYMEYDLKAETPIKDEDGVLVGLAPSQEDSLDRLLALDKQYADSTDLTEIVLSRIDVQELYHALALLSEEEQALIDALFFEGITEQEYAVRTCRKQQSVNERKLRILKKINKLLKSDF